MNNIIVDEKKCKHDGICAAVCPKNIIEQKVTALVPSLVAGVEELCIKCGHCVAICPHGALSLGEMKTEECPPVRAELMPNIEQVAYMLRSRRSIRVYREKGVERDKLDALIDMAHYAPTGTNSQQVQWLVIDSKELLNGMAAIVNNMLRHLIKEGHPLVTAYRLDRCVAAWEAGLDQVLRGAPALVVAHAPKIYAMGQTDCTIALTYLEQAAPTLGFGTCWAGLFMMAADKWPPLQQALALPDGHACFGALMVGYPKYAYHRLPLRKKAVINWR
jgi:nitroreductase/NAD-dependent dihydropyrimidine dehydrogenase PreA subunit